jgi:hypothetical protein
LRPNRGTANPRPQRRDASFATGSIFAFLRSTSNVTVRSSRASTFCMRSRGRARRDRALHAAWRGDSAAHWSRRSCRQSTALMRSASIRGDAAPDDRRRIHSHLSVGEPSRPHTRRPSLVVALAEGRTMIGHSATSIQSWWRSLSCGRRGHRRRRLASSGRLRQCAERTLPHGRWPAVRQQACRCVSTRPLVTFRAQGGDFPCDLPLIERIFAFCGQTVCRQDLLISVYRNCDGRGSRA